MHAGYNIEHPGSYLGQIQHMNLVHFSFCDILVAIYCD